MAVRHYPQRTALAADDSNIMRGWRREALGDPLLKLLRGEMNVSMAGRMVTSIGSDSAAVLCSSDLLSPSMAKQKKVEAAGETERSLQ
jgi:hypothetical protein